MANEQNTGGTPGSNPQPQTQDQPDNSPQIDNEVMGDTTATQNEEAVDDTEQPTPVDPSEADQFLTDQIPSEDENSVE